MLNKLLKISGLVFIVLFAFDSVACGQWLRNKIKEKMLERMDQKALTQEVKSQFCEITHDSIKRSYYLYVPSKWDKKSPLPVVFLFHGGGGGARGALYYYELEKKAEDAGFLLVAPNGTGESEHVLLTWNVFFGFGYAQKNKIDDVSFVKAVLAKVESEYPIDQKRIYATGLSNGAIFCHFLAADPDSRIAAIAPVVGTAGGREQHDKTWHKPAAPEIPVSVCIIQGLIDEHVPIKGGLQGKSITEPRYMLSASATIDFWVQANQCAVQDPPKVLSAYNATLHHFSGGKNNTEVSAYVIHDMGHAWPGSSRVPRAGSDKPSAKFPGNDIIWEFFKNHPRP